ncbi:cell wall protein, partial [Streptomyces parvulus]|nr:cell wall protein [Streptomyces parvulus]
PGERPGESAGESPGERPGERPAERPGELAATGPSRSVTPLAVTAALLLAAGTGAVALARRRR